MTALPHGWARVRLEEIAEVRLGRQRSPKNHSGSQMRPYLRAANVGWNGLRLDDVKQMNFTDAEAEIHRLAVDDIVVVEASGSPDEVGKPAIWRDEVTDCCLQNTLIRVRSAGVDPRYLLHFLDGVARSGGFVTRSRGVGINHLGSSRLAAWQVPVAPLDEQRRIVSILEENLSRVDAGTDLLRRIQSRSSQIEEGLLRALLVGPGDNGCADGPKSNNIDDGYLPPIPKSWRWMRLAEIAEVVGGVTKDSSRQSDPSVPLVPYLRVANVQRGWLDLTEVSEIRLPESRAKKLELQYGDVLLNEGGDRDKLGRGWIWEEQVGGCIHQNHVFRARIRHGLLNPKLLAWHANSFGRPWFERNGRQTTNLASISLSKIKQFPVPVPPVDEQTALVERIEDQLIANRRTADAARHALVKASHLRRSLLAEAFAGRFATQDPDDEPASVLLSRIKGQREKPRPTGRSRGATARE